MMNFQQAFTGISEIMAGITEKLLELCIFNFFHLFIYLLYKSYTKYKNIRYSI